MAANREQQLPVGAIPDTCGVIRASGGNTFAVGRECYGPNLICVAPEDLQKASIGHIPQPGCAVIASRDHSLPARRELPMVHSIIVAEDGQKPAILRAPQLGSVIKANAEDALPVR